MTKMILAFEQNLVDLAIFEAKDPVDVSIAEQVAEWKKLNKKFAVMNKISKLITSRINELEDSFEAVIKDVDGNKKVVDGCILEYTQKRSNQTVKYKESVDYAMKMMNEAQQKVLQAFVDSVTKAPEISSVLKVTDADLEHFLLDLKDTNADDLLDKAGDVEKFPRQVALAKKRDLKEGVLDNIAKVIKRAVATFKTKFAKLFKAFTVRDNATSALMKAVKATKVTESKKGDVTESSSDKDKLALINRVFTKLEKTELTEAFKVEAFQKDPKTVTEPAYEEDMTGSKKQATSLAKGWVKQGYFVSITDTVSGEVLNDYKPGDKVLEATCSSTEDRGMNANRDKGSKDKDSGKGPYKAVEDDEPGFKGKYRVEDSKGNVIMDDLTKEEARDLADSKNEKDGKKQVVAVDEAKNEFGEVEYSSFATWKSAIKRLNAEAWFDGDKDICNAFTGTKPYKRKETLGVGEWDGEKGVVFKGSAPKKAMTEAKDGALKKGDKVKRKDNGKTGTVGSVNSDNKSVNVIWDMGSKIPQSVQNGALEIVKAMTESIDKSKENMDKREYKMGRIESVFGTLESLEWSKLSDTDMDAIFDKLTELKLVKYDK